MILCSIAGTVVNTVQWVRESVQPISDGSRSVAVLLFEDATASDLARQLCKVVGCTLGMEVGLGTTNTTFVSPASQIVFMTPCYFLGLQASPAMQLSWKAFLIVDKAHVSHPDRDLLLVHLVDMVNTSVDAKVVVLKV